MSDIDVQAQAAEGVEPPLPLDEVERAVRWVLRAEGVEAAEISVTLLPDGEIAALNQQYLRHDGPTDVISFPFEGPAGGPILGDIYIGADQALRQAAELGTPPREELLRLAMHGTLHVLGYEHPEGDDRETSPMYQRQEQLLAEFVSDQRPDDR